MSLNHGPTIDELLADSLIQTVMRADQVEPQALKALLNGAASRIAATRRERAAERSGVVCPGHQANDEAGNRMHHSLLAGRPACVARIAGRGFAASDLLLRLR
jgi:hypothetical protein